VSQNYEVDHDKIGRSFKIKRPESDFPLTYIFHKIMTLFFRETMCIY